MITTHEINMVCNIVFGMCMGSTIGHLVFEDKRYLYAVFAVVAFVMYLIRISQ